MDDIGISKPEIVVRSQSMNIAKRFTVVSGKWHVFNGMNNCERVMENGACSGPVAVDFRAFQIELANGSCSIWLFLFLRKTTPQLHRRSPIIRRIHYLPHRYQNSSLIHQ